MVESDLKTWYILQKYSNLLNWPEDYLKIDVHVELNESSLLLSEI